MFGDGSTATIGALGGLPRSDPLKLSPRQKTSPDWVTRQYPSSARSSRKGGNRFGGKPVTVGDSDGGGQPYPNWASKLYPYPNPGWYPNAASPHDVPARRRTPFDAAAVTRIPAINSPPTTA